ncbi:MAG: YraN family protein [Myxococcales bacterium]|nr:YraN family protein [Myxococcales bacterium]
MATTSPPKPPSRGEGGDVFRELPASHVLGKRAEEAAVAALLNDGYVILGRNVRVSRLEIDIVARLGPVVVIVEVRTRGAGAWIKALDSLDWKKRARVRKAGEVLWRKRFKSDLTLERMRFDVVAVTFDDRDQPHVEHLKAAF